MKQQDIALIVLVVGISAIASYFIVNKFITPSSEKLEAEVVTEISSEFLLPDKNYFNDNSYNPTVRIDIAPVSNPTPFTNETN